MCKMSLLDEHFVRSIRAALLSAIVLLCLGNAGAQTATVPSPAAAPANPPAPADGAPAAAATQAPLAVEKAPDRVNSLGHAHYTSGFRANLDHIVHIDMRDNHCTPPLLYIQRGKRVMFIVSNRDQVEHTFALAVPPIEGAFNVMIVSPGKTGTLTWFFGVEGDIAFNCNSPNQDEKNMKGTITVRGLYPWERAD